MRIGRIFDPCAFTGKPLVARQAVNRAQQLEALAARAITIDPAHEFGWQAAPFDDAAEGDLRVQVGHHDAGLDFLAVGQPDAMGPGE